jgi:hypothetical protein
MPTCPPDNLVEPSVLTRFGVPGSFLAQFAPRSFQVVIEVSGTLGTMAISWRQSSTEVGSDPVISTTGATWTIAIDDFNADLTFAAGSYTATTVYTIDEAGNVTGGSGLTASRFDLRVNACSSVTTEALALMQDAVRQPLTAWGDDTRSHAAAMVYAWLKRSKGATAIGAGMGDENVFLAEDIGRKFFIGIGQRGKPPSISDTSTSSDGPMFAAYPTSDEPRGW